MSMRTINDPHGHPNVLVDTVFGASYGAVRTVANNIDYIKKVSNLFDTSDTIVSNIHQRYVSVQNQSVFELPVSVVSEAFVTVFVNGKWKSPAVTYTAYDTTLIFNQALSQGDVVDVMIVSSETFDALQNLKEAAKAWAESPTAPGDPGTKSAKTWAEEAAGAAAMRFTSVSVAEAATIPASVDVIEIIGQGFMHRDPDGTSAVTADGAKWHWTTKVEDRSLVVLCLGQSKMAMDYALQDNGERPHHLVSCWNGVEDDPGDAWVKGHEYTNSLGYNVCRELARRLTQPVKFIRFAKGGHTGLAFVKPATRAANSWTLDTGSYTDLTLGMYPGIANALAELQDTPTKVDMIVIDQGENEGANMALWAEYWKAAIADLVDEDLFDPRTGRIVFGGLTDGGGNGPNRFAQVDAVAQISLANNMCASIVTTHGDELDTVTSAIHLSVLGALRQGREIASELLRSPEPFPSFLIDGLLEVSLNTAADGSGLDIPASVDGHYITERKMVYRAAGGALGSPWGVGGRVDFALTISNLDFTGIAPTADIHIRMRPFDVRAGATSIYNIDVDWNAAVNEGTNGLIGRINPGSNPNLIIYRRDAVKRQIKAQDMPSGSVLNISGWYYSKLGELSE